MTSTQAHSIAIAPSLMDADTWYLYRGNQEIKIWLYEGEILSNYALSRQEKKHILNTILRPSKINSNEEL